MDAAGYLEDNLSHVESAIRAICIRHSIYGDDAEEFASIIKLKLIEDDYKRLRDFRGNSSLKTYLYAIINRLFIDELRSRKGRWRPSADARRLGPVAGKLEELICRDNNTFDEACYTILSIPSFSSYSRDQLYEIYLKLPKKENRHLAEADPECLSVLSSTDPHPDEVLHNKRMDSIERSIEGLIRIILPSLNEEDRLILKMRFDNDLSIAMITEVIGQKRGYVEKRISQILAGFKEEILSSGININDAMEVIKHIEARG
jgi:RNA polymerase sigma factor (sigma-70 family)